MGARLTEGPFRSTAEQILFFEERYSVGGTPLAKLANNKAVSRELGDLPMAKIWQFLEHFEHTFGENRKRAAQAVELETEDHVFFRLFENFNSNLNELRSLLLAEDLFFDDLHLCVEKARWVHMASKGGLTSQAAGPREVRAERGSILRVAAAGRHAACDRPRPAHPGLPHLQGFPLQPRSAAFSAD